MYSQLTTYNIMYKPHTVYGVHCMCVYSCVYTCVFLLNFSQTEMMYTINTTFVE